MEIFDHDVLISTVNYIIVPSIKKDKIYVRNIFYNDYKYLDLTIGKMCDFFSDKTIMTNIINNPLVKNVLKL